jgi:hypothetical protein
MSSVGGAAAILYEYYYSGNMVCSCVVNKKKLPHQAPVRSATFGEMDLKRRELLPGERYNPEGQPASQSAARGTGPVTGGGGDFHKRNPLSSSSFSHISSGNPKHFTTPHHSKKRARARFV